MGQEPGLLVRQLSGRCLPQLNSSLAVVRHSAELWASDFDIRHNLVINSSWELPREQIPWWRSGVG